MGTLGCSKGRTSFLRSGLTRHSAKQVLETRLGHGTFPARAWVESLVKERRLGKVHNTGKEGRKEGRGERWRREQMRRHRRQAEGREWCLSTDLNGMRGAISWGRMFQAKGTANADALRCQGLCGNNKGGQRGWSEGRKVGASANRGSLRTVFLGFPSFTTWT